MTVIARALTLSGDWTFGQGRNNYVSGNAQVAQNIQTRLGSFLGDCFFDQGAGLAWFDLLGSKNQLPLNLAINAIILNTDDVTGILQTSVILDASRNLSVSYMVQTIYSVLTGTYQYSQNGAV